MTPGPLRAQIALGDCDHLNRLAETLNWQQRDLLEMGSPAGPRAAPELGGASDESDPHWSFRDHRTMAQVIADESASASNSDRQRETESPTSSASR